VSIRIPDYQELYQGILKGCSSCPWKDRKSRTVPPEGPAPCRVMFIGRNPGVTEDEDGKPFIGRAGQALDRFLYDCDLKRSDVYITNTAKCYGGPADPCPTEEVFDTCESFLEKEIDLVNPEVIVTLGADAHRRLTCDLVSITRVQGSLGYLFNNTLNKSITVIPVTHPSFWIRNGNYYDRVIKNQIVPVLKGVLALEKSNGLDT
jgi:uracil-DNA glycosylase